MASISSAGSSNGLDVNVISAMPVANGKTPVHTTAPESQAAQASLSAMGRLHGALSTFLDAAQALTSADTWSATQASSSDEQTVSATSDSTAAVGTYDITVASLAQSQITSSTVFSGSNAVIGLGTLHFELGSWSGLQNSFATNPNWPKSDIRIDRNDSSLERIRDRINAAGVGVIATVLSDATGSWLVLRSTGSGSENGFKVTATDETGQRAENGLAALGFDASALGRPQMSLTQAAGNASGTINGQPYESSSNTITDAVPGVTLQLQRASQATVKVEINTDRESIKQSVEHFARAYNDLNTLVKAQLSESSDTENDVTRQTAQAVQKHMHSITGQGAGNGSLSRWLSDIGLTVQADQSLQVDPVKLDQAVTARLSQTQRMVADAAPLPDTAQASVAPPSSTDYRTRLASQYQMLTVDSSSASFTGGVRSNHRFGLQGNSH